MYDWQTIFYALLGGILPAVIWLTFWLFEDRKKPEPKRLILRTFILGMLAVIIVLPLQSSVDHIFPNMAWQAFVLWALLEEGFKLAAAYFGGLRTPEDNEPIDPLVYMITAALGFVALENTLFIATSLLEEGSVMAVITGNMRFVGASLLHTFTSGIIGVAIGFSFYKRALVRNVYALVAFILAVSFHVVFNLTLFRNTETGATLAFGAVWVGIALIILMFERLKVIAPTE